jgi:mRNA interferase YafQ
MKKRGKSFGELKKVLTKIANDEALDAKYRDHLLIGQYKGTRECHLEPDWLLVYEVREDELILVRTGTHDYLF